ncbi:hypothetical protein P9Z56_29145 [Bacillus cereus]|nr:hypothetical protein [Bacillus cereus]MEC2745703.1 hypothetical protein [Bacillus cereus]MEC2757615.1 hypothetical protein [Bacillus cereus]MEC2830214.1 hypothetical protein [Bacillus cereus]
MPVLTHYWFQDTDFRGNTFFANQAHGAGAWAWINSNNNGAFGVSTLVMEREDREIVIDLPPLFNDQNTLSLIDRILGGQAQRTSQIKVGWIPWRYVPYKGQNPSKHGALDLLVRIYFDFHIDTPWYCSDVDGNISYYVVPTLDREGSIGAFVDGWSYDYNGGALVCTGKISDKLSNQVPTGVGTLQTMLDSRLALFGERRFDMLYLLPGDGTKSGTGTVNVNEHVSLALLPR